MRNLTILSIQHLPAIVNKYGRGEKSVALLQALRTPLPRLWEAAIEREANEARLEVDVLLDAEIEELEEQDCHLAVELVQMMAFAPDESDEEQSKSWTLATVPAALKTELDAYALHRTEPLNRARDGSCVLDITVGSDHSTCLRFLGWLAAERELTPGLGVFARAGLAEWAEDYAKALSAKGLKFSTIANYLNGLAMVGQFVYQTYEVDSEALAMPTSPLDQVLRLRGQCESQARQQTLYARRDPNWIDWPDAQRARMAAERAYSDLPQAPPARKAQALREWLIISLHTCMPPDRTPPPHPPTDHDGYRSHNPTDLLQASA